jgi:hypothetical protein
MVSHLWKGWYGKGETYRVGHALHKTTDNINALCGVPVSGNATKCTPQCKGISGTITTLTTNLIYLDDGVDIHIDVLVLDFARGNEEVDGSGDQS